MSAAAFMLPSRAREPVIVMLAPAAPLDSKQTARFLKLVSQRLHKCTGDKQTMPSMHLLLTCLYAGERVGW